MCSGIKLKCNNRQMKAFCLVYERLLCSVCVAVAYMYVTVAEPVVCVIISTGIQLLYSYHYIII